MDGIDSGDDVFDCRTIKGSVWRIEGRTEEKRDTGGYGVVNRSLCRSLSRSLSRTCRCLKSSGLSSKSFKIGTHTVIRNWSCRQRLLELVVHEYHRRSCKLLLLQRIGLLVKKAS